MLQETSDLPIKLKEDALKKATDEQAGYYESVQNFNAEGIQYPEGNYGEPEQEVSRVTSSPILIALIALVAVLVLVLVVKRCLTPDPNQPQ